MSYTNVELLSHRLISTVPLQDRIYDQVVHLRGTTDQPFYGGAVDGDSMLVKSIRSQSLTRQSLLLSSAELAVASTPLVPGSVVIASDSSLGVVYAENVDFAVDWPEGKIKIKESGSLALGTTVTIWYLPYTVCQAGSDYVLDAARAELRRTNGSSLSSGERVFVDFSPRYESFDQIVLDNAVVEANGTIEREVDPDRQFGADPTLQAAATYRALAVVCRTAAGRELSSGRGEDRIASVWLKLAEVNSDMAEKYLAGFRAPLTGPSHPSHG